MNSIEIKLQKCFVSIFCTQSRDLTHYYLWKHFLVYEIKSYIVQVTKYLLFWFSMHLRVCNSMKKDS